MSSKFALLIGNSEFRDPALQRLSAPANDVEALCEVLADPDIAGFEVKFLLDRSLEEVREGVSDFFSDRDADDLLLFYYTGHGLRDNRGRLYLALPATKSARPRPNSLDAGFLRDEMQDSRSTRQAIILDCCHAGAIDVTGAKRAKDEPTLIQTDFDPSGHGRYVLAASAAEESAFEVNGRSIFTRYIVEALRTGAAAPECEEVTLNNLHTYVSRQVAASGAPMQPRLWVDEQMVPLTIARNPAPVSRLDPAILKVLDSADINGALGAATRLLRMCAVGSSAEAKAARQALETRLERRETLNVDLYDVITDGLRSLNASSRLSDSNSTRPARLGEDGYAPSNETVTREVGISSGKEPSKINQTIIPKMTFRDTLRDGTNGPEMVKIPQGKFTMGSSEKNGLWADEFIDGEEGRYEDEGPQHEVSIPREFALSVHQCTFDEFDVFCRETGNDRPSDEGWGRGRRPVINVSWEISTAYCDWLSEETGADYRLPSETEWEYACRAGTATRFAFGEDITKDRANFGSNNTISVDELDARNAWGLRHMHGNVWEWCADTWISNYKLPRSQAPLVKRPRFSKRVMRGGSWVSIMRDLRSAMRGSRAPDTRADYLGFRVARSCNSE